MECYDCRVTSSKSKLYNMQKPGETGVFCDNMNISNIQVTRDGRYMNVGENMYSNRQGLWGNFLFNSTRDPCIPVETYSNLQVITDNLMYNFWHLMGSWSRVGPSTYDSLHNHGDQYNRWAAGNFLPQPVKSLYDHRNVDPKGLWSPEGLKEKLPY
ncbi:hypothetical protein HELRODRAFT_192374 [Helobdella robusta]|uniref:Uncharacterized protein n=1 Tax=Helobdella robusta TaxID=6412 RepID=T1FTV7_HELRO|nr:hypothetical protein HELRODRAFT_192374 [Helobdella robusta]ESO01093.1 hypothetical protein HELRODRAFT_192374 [Helobdella robusta]